jgi:hypothetical protein
MIWIFLGDSVGVGGGVRVAGIGDGEESGVAGSGAKVAAGIGEGIPGLPHDERMMQTQRVNVKSNLWGLMIFLMRL